MEIAFTWAPRRYSVTPIRTFETDVRVLFPYLHKCSEQFLVYPEFTLKGQLHYHALINVSDKAKWYGIVLPKFNSKGFTCVKVCQNKAKWLSYISKDVEMMRRALNYSDIPLHEDNIPAKVWKSMIKFGPPVNPAELDSNKCEPATHTNNNIINYITIKTGAAGQK